MWATFLARIRPVSTSENPALSAMTRTAAHDDPDHVDRDPEPRDLGLDAGARDRRPDVWHPEIRRPEWSGGGRDPIALEGAPSESSRNRGGQRTNRSQGPAGTTSRPATRYPGPRIRPERHRFHPSKPQRQATRPIGPALWERGRGKHDCVVQRAWGDRRNHPATRPWTATYRLPEGREIQTQRGAAPADLEEFHRPIPRPRRAKKSRSVRTSPRHTTSPVATLSHSDRPAWLGNFVLKKPVSPNYPRRATSPMATWSYGPTGSARSDHQPPKSGEVAV